MSTVRRISRYRREDAGDPIAEAWDSGNPPPPEAYAPANLEHVGDCIFFRWAEHKPAWTGEHHPHAAAWHDAIATSRD